jgi:hypothetical protein
MQSKTRALSYGLTLRAAGAIVEMGLGGFRETGDCRRSVFRRRVHLGRKAGNSMERGSEARPRMLQDLLDGTSLREFVHFKTEAVS